jgi:hypothetical protein
LNGQWPITAPGSGASSGSRCPEKKAAILHSVKGEFMLKKIVTAAVIWMIFLTGNLFGAKQGGFEGEYFWTVEEAVITFSYDDFHVMINYLREKDYDAYKKMLTEWRAHIPRGTIYVRVLKEYDDGILKVQSINGGYYFFIFRDYLIAEF